MSKDYPDYYNKGNNCDTCRNQYLWGTDGDKVGCILFDARVECEYDPDPSIDA